MGSILLHALTAILYLLLGVYFWRTRWRGSEAVGVAIWERFAVLLPFGLHSWLLYLDLFASPELRFGFGHALSVTLWLCVLVYWIESLFVNLQGMNAIVLPVAAVCAFLPAVFAGLATPVYAQHFEFRAHLAVAMAAYSLFTLAAMHALLMALLERRLHGESAGGSSKGSGLLGGPFANLPPLLTLETLLFRMLGIGFVLLSLTLISGVFFSEALFQQAFKFSHKTLFAVLSWLIFGALLAGRRLYGWRGRRALRWTLAGFLTLLLAYVGSRFVLEVVLNRSLG
ncbi:MAG TPA: cytochrome c biogenesis protein CcsA [Burkholderiales bacterium]|jgi:ABC-type uncharacterized transport system permease subunit|nr:cytochrome c biogenesis protein CcsA [Burkholderiales bacterium]